MTLDIEHALKTQLLYDLSQNSEEEQKALVEWFFSGNWVKEEEDG